MTAACVLAHRHEPDRERRAIDGALACLGCARRLARMLDQAAGQYVELTFRLAPGNGGSGEHLTGTPERALPIVPAVVDHRDAIRRQFAAWSLRVAQARGLLGPLPRMAAMTEFLRQWLDWIITQPWLTELDERLRQLDKRSRALLSPAGIRRVDAGQCREDHEGGRCPGTLTALLYPHPERDSSRLICDACPLLVPLVELPSYARSHGLTLYVDGEVTNFLTGLSEPLIRQWSTRGHISRCGADPVTGRTLYDLTEVLAHQSRARRAVA